MRLALLNFGSIKIYIKFGIVCREKWIKKEKRKLNTT